MRVEHGDPAQWGLGERPHAVTIGVYDGVHRGHLHVFEQLRAVATAHGADTGLVTFDRHPLTVTAPESAPRILTSVGRKLELFEEAGIDAVGVLPFGNGVREMSPEEFARVVLLKGFGAVAVVVGEDFRFGKERTGDAVDLIQLGDKLGFDVEVLPLVNGDGPLSSTHIRELIAEGDVVGASEALGRRFEMRGRVVKGSGRGARIGIPTANLEVGHGMAVPKRGVYAVRVMPRRGDGSHEAVLNIGVRPTFGGTRETIEAHLFDFDRDIYGSDLRVQFIGRIRDERRFSGPEELVAQIQDDMATARKLLAAHPS
jgi:riboflavin kinase/FMN adenylyltransferase